MLLGGDHQKITEYRFISAVAQTLKKRPDLIVAKDFSNEEILLLKRAGLLDQVNRLKTV